MGGRRILLRRIRRTKHAEKRQVRALREVRASGSIPQFINDYKIDNGIMYSVVKNHVPFVLTGSIRDDGPLPEVIGDAYQGQSEMRKLVKKCTTISPSGVS